MTLGARLAQERKACRFTQREASAHLGVNHTYLSKLEHDVPGFSPSPSLLERMVRLYAIEGDDIFILAGKCPPDLLEVMSHNLPFVNAVRALLPAPADVPS